MEVGEDEEEKGVGGGFGLNFKEKRRKGKEMENIQKVYVITMTVNPENIQITPLLHSRTFDLRYLFFRITKIYKNLIL